ncbi:hypothetical protein [Roseomonas genomospecies 6]|uniref:Uncharacterized protein n=1 Tax=Roseomonas genomospecies 6 TaxID=214106 RepID=A0A9W7TVM7_9PROT|nr:hypothetical protein [Roseomonas genomospecies 6]KAA0679176.1 hypothetical protein DS843_16830 [Roseomonas genomospecies 6]
MVETRRTGDRSNEPIRSDAGGGRVASPGAAAGIRSRAEQVGGGRQRIPTVRELASLVVNGILTLPRNYRRGMYLDVQV